MCLNNRNRKCPLTEPECQTERRVRASVSMFRDCTDRWHKEIPANRRHKLMVRRLHRKDDDTVFVARARPAARTDHD